MRRSSNQSIDEEDSSSVEDGLEIGRLAIRDSRPTTSKDIWQRTNRRQTDGSRSVIFEILYARILPPIPKTATSGGGKKYVIYDLIIRHQCDVVSDETPITIGRRYTNFRELYLGLRRDHSDLLQNFYFPSKVLMGNFSNDVITERSTAFETLLDLIIGTPTLRDSPYFLHFLQGIELNSACQLLDERRNEQAVPILENCFKLLNKIYMDRSKHVLLLLCRLVAACTASPIPHPRADYWADLALRRYDSVSDADLLVLYIPLLQTCMHLWWQRGRDNKFLEERLNELSSKGIPVKGGRTLTQAIHYLDPRAETI